VAVERRRVFGEFIDQAIGIRLQCRLHHSA
jgi:hypothetical protein